MRNFVRLMFAFSWCYCCVTRLPGQHPGQVRGTVEDPNGAAVAQAALKLTPKGRGTALKTVSDNTGAFVFAAVEPGEYLLAVKAPNFEEEETPLSVNASTTPDQRIRLKLAEVKDEITISAKSD